ncbi:MAG: L,D-transpeptidase family protein [Methylophaga sp.]|nr:L,D-transpeptidase family protein [Methylophaga sp.]
MKFGLCLVLASYFLTAVTIAKASTVELLVVHSQNKLLVKQDDLTLRTFRVALGSGGREHKQMEGDRRTPLGTYRITEVRPSDRWHTFLQMNYPNMDDARIGLRNGLITREQYRAILQAHVYGELPPQNTPLGGAIGIHGIGEETEERLNIHEIANWTQGCIAMRNHEVKELLMYISEGANITIIE